MTAVEYRPMDQELARNTPTDLLVDAPPWALVIWSRPHPEDVGLMTYTPVPVGAVQPHTPTTPSPIRRTDVIGTFFDEDNAQVALDDATTVLTNILVFGMPSTNMDHASVAVNVTNVREQFTLDLRELMNQGRAEHRKRLSASMDDALGNRERRVIDLDGDAEPAVEPLPFPATVPGGEALGVQEGYQRLQDQLLEGMGVPEELMTGGTSVMGSGVRAAQDELARRSMRPRANEPRDLR